MRAGMYENCKQWGIRPDRPHRAQVCVRCDQSRWPSIRWAHSVAVSRAAAASFGEMP